MAEQVVQSKPAEKATRVRKTPNKARDQDAADRIASLSLPELRSFADLLRKAAPDVAEFVHGRLGAPAKP